MVLGITDLLCLSSNEVASLFERHCLKPVEPLLVDESLSIEDFEGRRILGDDDSPCVIGRKLGFGENYVVAVSV